MLKKKLTGSFRKKIFAHFFVAEIVWTVEVGGGKWRWLLVGDGNAPADVVVGAIKIGNVVESAVRYAEGPRQATR